MRINNNISAMNTYSRLNSANNAKSGSLAKLSSGLRINRAGDDAAGLAISEKMRGQIGGLKQSVRNAQDGISLIQTAEGALTETHSILNRMRELAVQASTDTNTVEDRAEIQKEIDELATEITRISTDTEFNTMKLLDGSRATEDLTFHIGANQSQNLKLKIADMGAEALKVHKTAREAVASEGSIQGINIKAADGKSYEVEIKVGTTTDAATAALVNNKITVTLANDASDDLDGVAAAIKGITGNNFTNTAVDGTANGADAAGIGTATVSGGSEEVLEGAAGGIHVSTQAEADAAITIINDAINTVSAERSKLGATQNRLDHTINNLTATAENLSEAESRIRDVDMAEEMMEFTKNNILSQAATSMLAQANQMPQSVLQLLQ